MEHINKARLDELRIEAMAGAKKFIRLKDKRVKSLFWQATQKGAVTGVIRYSFDDTDTVFTVAEFGNGVNQFTITAIIAKAMKVATEIKNGGNPQAKHKVEKAERALIKMVRRAPKSDNDIYVTDKANEYYRQHTGMPRTKISVRAGLDEIVKAFGHKRVKDVTREDVANLLLNLESRGAEDSYSVAMNCQKTGRAFWVWGLDIGGFEDALNYFAGLKSFKKKYRDAAKRTREKGRVTMVDVRAMAEEHYYRFSENIQRAIILQVYTAVRPANVTSSDPVKAGGPRFPLCWSEFDLKNGVWSMEAVRMKGREQSHIIDLPRQALIHLRAWHKEDGHPKAGIIVRSKRRLNGTLTSNDLGKAYREVGLSYTPHKWRHLISSNIAEKHGAELAELVLAHYTSNAYYGVTRRKDRAECLQEWADMLDGYGFDKLLPCLLQ